MRNLKKYHKAFNLLRDIPGVKRILVTKKFYKKLKRNGHL